MADIRGQESKIGIEEYKTDRKVEN